MGVGLMEVSLVNAKGLKSSDFLGKIDPYVIIQYKGQIRESSVARGQGRKPTWNERFTFRVEYPGSGNEYKLILRLMDHDTFSRDDSLGQTTIYVKDVLETGVEDGSAELKPQKYSVVAEDQTYVGEIQVGVSFTLQPQGDDGEEEFGGWKDSEFD